MSCEPAKDSAGNYGHEGLAVLIGFQSSLHRNFCNACVKQASVMRQYTGSLLGHCETVECVEGCWPKNYGLGVLIFDQARECAKWTTSDPVFRAQDFLEQVEMYCVPLNASIPADYHVLSIMDLDTAGPNQDAMASHVDCVRAAGGLPCVAATGKVHKVRGLRSPGFYIIDAWRSADQFHAWYSSEAGVAEREHRQQATSGDVILACLTRVI